VHIEESSGLQFACFRGGYPEHEAHLRQCSLFPPASNYWHSIYDHNSPSEGEQDNWKLLPEEECADWFPVGQCASVIPLTTAATTAGVSNHHQVGEAFGMEQMKQDKKQLNKREAVSSTMKSTMKSSSSVLPQDVSSKVATTQEFSFEQMIQDDTKKQEKNVTLNVPSKSSPKSTPATISTPKPVAPAVTPLPKPYLSDEDEVKVNQLGIEIALLVASARAKGINVSVWLSESVDNKVVPVADFNSRFISLGLAVGIQEDFETKREIDNATDAMSLASIATICSAGYDSTGVPLIDVHMFLMLAQAKVDRFLLQGQAEEEIVEEEEEEEEEEVVPEPVFEKEEPILQVGVEVAVEEDISDEVKEEKEEEEEEGSLPPPPLASDKAPLSRQHAPPLRSKSAPPRQRSSSSRESAPRQGSLLLTSSTRQPLAASSLEELLMATLKQPDLYHVIQVGHSFVRSFIHSFIHSFVHSFIHSFVHSFIHLL
jgi:hypothetical protein